VEAGHQEGQETHGQRITAIQWVTCFCPRDPQK
jgi:hypothetical protein